MARQFLNKEGLTYFKKKVDMELAKKSAVDHDHQEILTDKERAIVSDMELDGIEQTLYAGETILTFTSDRIKETSVIDIMVDRLGIIPKFVDASNGSVVIIFNKMKEDLKVKLLIHDGIYELIGVDSLSATANTNDIISGKTAYVKGEKITGTITVNDSGETVVPTTSDITFVQPDTKLESDYTIAGANTLLANNIKKGVSIFGVTGTLENVINDIQIDGVSLDPSDSRLKNGALNITANYTTINIQKASLPYSAYYASSVVYEGEIHYLGSAYLSTSNSHIKYNPTTDTWSTVSTLPIQFVRGKAVVYNNEIHIIGSAISNAERSHYKWNGSEWVSVSTLPYVFGSGAAFVLNGFIHIMGGSNTGIDAHYIWNGVEWVKSNSLAYEFNYGGCLVYNNELHLIGGWNTDTGTNHYAFNPHTCVWRKVSTLPYSFDCMSVLLFGNEIHILGNGSDTNTQTSHYKWDGSEWVSVGTLPYTFAHGCAVSLNNKLHIMGSSITGNQNLHYIVESVEYTINE